MSSIQYSPVFVLRHSVAVAKPHPCLQTKCSPQPLRSTAPAAASCMQLAMFLAAQVVCLLNLELVMHGVLFPSPAACFMKLNRRRNVANVRRSEDPRTPRLTRRGRRVALIACGSQLPQMIFFFFFLRGRAQNSIIVCHPTRKNGEILPILNVTR